MPTPSHATAAAAAAAAQERLLRSVGPMLPEQVREPSLLPGWSRGHVLTHIARNADALGNLIRGARTGQSIPMYPSPEARDRDIEAGAGRGPAEQYTDLRDADLGLHREFAAMPDAAWSVVVPHRLGPFPAEGVPEKRLKEIEYHHVDLGLDYRPEHWSAEFVESELGRLTAVHTDSGLLAPELLKRLEDAPGHARVAWMSGRSDGSDLGVPITDLPVLPPLG
ncbi:maleylpyruvate isomerase N-terminal domain-containing protein [Streptacidiphilus albus]|uniref:maleylpyruvate isomerase N-terminal domain-containing protein n=1 Tax=Streptacidiphilus albus TaxID=105425 RepID=UPI00054C3152|nr:maleylpyruvate isomerase N-terminal domain-containing protein [Streptacidiphilus albus]